MLDAEQRNRMLLLETCNSDANVLLSRNGSEHAYQNIKNIKMKNSFTTLRTHINTTCCVHDSRQSFCAKARPVGKQDGLSELECAHADGRNCREIWRKGVGCRRTSGKYKTSDSDANTTKGRKSQVRKHADIRSH